MGYTDRAAGCGLAVSHRGVPPSVRNAGLQAQAEYDFDLGHAAVRLIFEAGTARISPGRMPPLATKETFCSSAARGGQADSKLTMPRRGGTTHLVSTRDLKATCRHGRSRGASTYAKGGVVGSLSGFRADSLTALSNALSSSSARMPSAGGCRRRCKLQHGVRGWLAETSPIWHGERTLNYKAVAATPKRDASKAPFVTVSKWPGV